MATGIVNSALDDKQPTATQPVNPNGGVAGQSKEFSSGGNSQQASTFKAPDMKPMTSQVDAPQETVEGRLNNLTSGKSAYVNQARNDASRQANSRGLINSSMAAGAGQEAAIRSAMPIAQQDAKTYTDTRFNNQEATNKFLGNRQSADLNMETAAHQSQLTLGENDQLNELQMKRDSGLSELTKEEADQLNQLQMKRDQAQSGLTQQENTQLNDLQMKRDKGLSELTREEQTLLNDLNTKRDAAASDLRKSEMAEQNKFDVNRDNNSSKLNQDLARLESSLNTAEMTFDTDEKIRLEQILSNDKVSDELKVQAVNTVNNIVRDTQAQIAEIGLSDRSAEAQAAAILRVQQNANHAISVYQDMLGDSVDMKWSGDYFTAPEGLTVEEQKAAITAGIQEQAAAAAVPGKGTYWEGYDSPQEYDNANNGGGGGDGSGAF